MELAELADLPELAPINTHSLVLSQVCKPYALFTLNQKIGVSTRTREEAGESCVRRGPEL
jgi:hypothetical protein